MLYYIIKRNTKKIAIASTILMAAVGSYFTAPLIHKTYKKHQANTLISATSTGLISLRDSIKNTRQTLDNTGFILLEKEKKEGLEEIADSEEKASQINSALITNKTLFTLGQYDSIRQNLDETFGLGEGKTRLTPCNVADEETSQMRSLATTYLNKRGSRDTANFQELELRSYLASPLPKGMAEKKGKHSNLSEEQYAKIPTLNPDLQVSLASLGSPNLNNHLGVLLLENLPLVEHLQEKGRNERVKTIPLTLFQQARDCFVKVRPLNDSLTVWYEAKRDDGSFTQEAYDNLLAAQKKPLDHIAEGKIRLSEIVAFNNEVHNQYYIYVSGQNAEQISFKHTKKDREYTYGPVWSDKNLDYVWKWHWENVTKHYKTPGMRFKYTLTNVGELESSTQSHISIEKDSETDSGWQSHAYPLNQQIGRLQKWKQFHNDNVGIVTGSMKDLNPNIEKEE